MLPHSIITEKLKVLIHIRVKLTVFVTYRGDSMNVEPRIGKKCLNLAEPDVFDPR